MKLLHYVYGPGWEYKFLTMETKKIYLLNYQKYPASIIYTSPLLKMLFTDRGLYLQILSYPLKSRFSSKW